jgi:rod shape-determining protein MreC
LMYRRSTRQRVALLALLAATATVVTLDFRSNPGGPIRRVQDFAVSVIAPVQEAIDTVFEPVGDFLGGLRELPGLRKENARLRDEVESLETDLRNLPEIQREYEELVNLVSEKSWKQGETLGARVIGGQTSNLEASRLLNKGVDDGVKVGMSVVSAEGLVGRISFTAPRYSKVLLVNDPRHAVGARLVTSGETGVLGGRNEEDLLLDLISPEVPVEVGESVVTSGYDRGIYPAGIPIGRVTDVSVSRDRLSKTALVRPYVNFGKLDIVLVLMESGEVVGPNG